MMQYIRSISMGALMVAATGCMATQEDLAALGKANEAEESTAQQTEPLASCAWGGGNYVRKGFSVNSSDLSVLSPSGSNVYRYTPSRLNSALSVFDTLTIANRWGGADYTWAADINHDGFTDLISASGDRVYVNKFVHELFASSFDSESWTTINRWGGGDYTFVADFSGDRNLDIVSANGGHLYFRKTNANADGFDGSLIDTWNDGRWGGAAFTFAGDFNGDRKADIVSFNGTSAYMKLKRAEGDTFVMDTWGVSGHDWSGDGHTYAGDINGDGRTDVVTINGSTVTTYRANSTGTNFTSSSFNDGAVSWGDARHTFLADFNNDGAADLATINAGFVYIFFGKNNDYNNTPYDSNRASRYALSNYMMGDGEHTFAGPFQKKTVAVGEARVEVSGGADIVTFNGCTGRLYRFSDGKDGRSQKFDTLPL